LTKENIFVLIVFNSYLLKQKIKNSMPENINDIIPDFWVSANSTIRCLGKACHRAATGRSPWAYIGLATTGVLCSSTCAASTKSKLLPLTSLNKYLMSCQLLAEGACDATSGYEAHTMNKN
jgi:hypothetical protein